MNRYGEQAMNHWRQFRPREFAEIRDPETYFATLGEEVSEQIAMLTMQLAGDDPPDEGFVAKQGRLTNARYRAEEMILPERVLVPAEPGSPMDESEA